MERIDRLFDSFEKRVLWLLLFLCAYLVMESCRDYFLGVRLIFLREVKDLYTLLDTKELYASFFGQLILYFLEHKRFALFSFLSLIGLKRLVCFLLHVLLLLQRGKEERKCLFVFSLVSLLCFLAVYVSSALFLLKAVSAMEVTEAMGALGTLANVLQYGSLLRIVCLLGAFFNAAKQLLLDSGKEA